MISNYLKIALRNLSKNKTYSFINIFGLAVGITCCLLILFFIRDEFSYDKFHDNSHRLYRVFADAGRAESLWKEKQANSCFPLGPALEAHFPEVLHAVRFREGYQAVVGNGDVFFPEDRFYFTDPNVFNAFTFSFIAGDPETALQSPNSIVLTESAAHRYFGEDDPMGRRLSYDGWGGKKEFSVTGLLHDLPHNTHFNFEFLVSLASVDLQRASWTGFTSLWTYILLPENYPVSEFRQKIPNFIETQVKPTLSEGSTFRIDLEPLKDIHLYSRLGKQIKPNSDITYIILFAAVALFILMIACINFINLSTARSMQRSKEIGLRKVIGAQRRHLIRQLLGEALLTTTIAMLVAITLFEIALPYLNLFANKNIIVDYFSDYWIAVSLLTGTLLVGLLSGLYPAFFLTAIKPVTALASAFTRGAKGAALRKALVVLQFAISIVLLLATSVVYRQLDFVRAKRLGASIDQVVVIPYGNSAEPVKSELLKNPAIVHVSASSRVPVNDMNFDTRPVKPEGFQDRVQVENFNIDEHFVETYGIRLVAGRDLSTEFRTDSTAFLINEAAIKHFGWRSAEEALGKQLDWLMGYKKGQIVGVVEDFHMESFHGSINPLVMHMLRESFWYDFISIKVRPENLTETLQFIETTWRSTNPQGGYRYFFMDDSFAQLHRSDEQYGQLLGGFSAIAILLASLGLYGLATFTAEKRLKEVGVRKVLGASVANIVLMLSREFTQWVLAANIVALPVGYFLMENWLNNFAYRTEISPDVLLFSSLLTIMIAFLTVAVRSYKSAISNPAVVLRYE